MLHHHRRQTKIVWSIECSRLAETNLSDVEKMDVEAIRIVHSPNTASQIIPFIRKLRSQANCVPAVMLDLSTVNRASVVLNAPSHEFAYGQTVRLVPEGKSGGIHIKTNQWESLFEPEATVFLGYGNVILKIKNIGKDFVEAEVTQSGILWDGSDVSIPATRRHPVLADLEDSELDQFLSEELDYLIIPALQSSEILALQNHIQTKLKTCPFIILKVDSITVANDLDAIFPLVDGVMISRREIALTTDPAAVPMVTKEIIQKGGDLAKLVVTASEMLASMRLNPTPTRAEVSDVANAVIDGTDAVIISEEVSLGRHAIKACQLMDRIIREIEQSEELRPNWTKHAPIVQTEFDAVAYAAYRSAQRLGAKAIVCITHSGNTALRLASFRAPVPILAVTFTDLVRRRLTLIRGVEGIVLNSEPKLDDVLPSVNDRLKKNGALDAGDRIIFVSLSLSSVGREASNLFTVHEMN